MKKKEQGEDEEIGKEEKEACSFLERKQVPSSLSKQ